jgi:hypothetical protein
MPDQVGTADQIATHAWDVDFGSQQELRHPFPPEVISDGIWLTLCTARQGGAAISWGYKILLPQTYIIIQNITESMPVN